MQAGGPVTTNATGYHDCRPRWPAGTFSAGQLHGTPQNKDSYFGVRHAAVVGLLFVCPVASVGNCLSVV